MKKPYLFVCVILVIFSCKKDIKNKEISSEALFTEISSNKSHIIFNNKVKESYDFNFLVYFYIYNGAGVAIGDINNDGLQDIYFSSNQNSNKLYLNKGDFVFEDITSLAKVEDEEGWSTGVSMIDINNDGWLDIYVCKSASLKSHELRRNKLFINQKNNTFKESAKEYGLDHPGFSTQAYFLDFDKDGDLDMYLVNHRYDFDNNSKISTVIQNEIQEVSSDQLFRNDGNVFTKVSNEAGVLNKAWGLSASIGDFNNDDWPDIYVSNDYLEPDILYINNKDGTFKNEILNRMNHISFNSMGSDYADINNDMKPDLLVLDMLAEDHSRSKENMASMSTSNFNTMVRIGYHHQYMSNILQLNDGNGSYNDISQLAGISKTDWSWAPLIADFDNDGYKDIFITNGIEKDLGNQDFRYRAKQINSQGISLTLDSVLNMIPSEKLPNYIFKNNGNLTFTKKIKDWGFEKKANSNGVAYADLDNDGDLDLVINNENDIATIYKNNAKASFISIKLIGSEQNKFAIGAKIRIETETGEQYQELYLNRGYLSSVTNVINFGLNNLEKIDKIEVVWPDNKRTVLNNVNSNQTLVIEYKDAKSASNMKSKNKNPKYFHEIPANKLGVQYRHKENLFNDFSKQLLLPQKLSTVGPCIAVADVNNDGLEDFYVGGAKDQKSELYIQISNGTFRIQDVESFELDKNKEDNNALFFDVDNDGDQDLYIASGGYEFNENDELLQDRLYINDGKGNFTKMILPKMHTSTKAVKAFDFDNDGDLDLVIGGNVIPGKYPLNPKSYILENIGGAFKDVTQIIAPEFNNIGMISDIEITDYNNDGKDDIMVVGHWMPITMFQNNNGKFSKVNIQDFEKTEGWYYAIASSDFDNDGDTDYVIGNVGMNNKFHPSLEKPLHIFSNDFDDNGSYDIALSKVYKNKLVPVRGKECSSEQTPFLNNKIKSYKEFGSLNIEGIYGNENISNANHLKAYNFKTVYIENLGNGNFNISKLPNASQKSPTLDFEIIDINKDGFKDIIGIGNLYDTEVETIRYDASQGYALLNNKGKGFTEALDTGFICKGDMRSISKITINKTTYFIVANNNDSLKFFLIND